MGISDASGRDTFRRITGKTLAEARDSLSQARKPTLSPT
jgi:hypothetical protein